MTSIADTTFDRSLKTALYWQLYLHLRDSILAGRLKKGTKLPSTRALAAELNVSRNTVLNAYEQLLAEGYLESIEASGTFVAAALPDTFMTSAPSPPRPGRSSQLDSPHPNLSRNGEVISAVPDLAPHTGDEFRQRPFVAGIPALDAFPSELWGKLVARRARHITSQALTYQESIGYQPLREVIAAHVTVTRRVHCTPDQVIITAGSQGALDLAARVLLSPGDSVWIEDPGYPGARGALLAAGATIIPVPVDNEGLNVSAGIALCPDARLVYLTPSHQFPLGMTMSLSRRVAVLEWAKRAGAYILEDDYDSEYRFTGRSLATLQGLDEADRVIYIGTFSKVMFPALRLGYLILPQSLVDPFLAMRRYIDTHPPLLEQAVLADFIGEGHFNRHLRRMRTLYAERRATLLAAMKELPLEIHAAETGMHCIGWLPAEMSDEVVSRRAAAHDVHVTPLSKFSMMPMARQGLLLGYSGIDESHIRDGAHRLAIAIRETGTIK